MCPVCATTAVVLTAGATSGGGLTAFVWAKFYQRKQKIGRKENESDGKQNSTNEKSRNRIGN
jgi:hypothetical protein